MEWLNEPASWQRTGGLLAVSVDPETDFWRETGYGYIRDSGHLYGELASGDLDVWVRIRASLGTQYDQAGVMLRVDSRTWLKAGLELFEGQPRLSTVVTLGQSSWMVASLPDETNEITLRVSRRGDGVQVRYQVGDGPFQLAALAYLPPDREVMAGVMCAAPEGGGFSVTFHDLRVVRRDWESAAGGEAAAEGEAAAVPGQAADAPAGWQETAGQPDDAPAEWPEPGTEAGEPWAPARETAEAWAEAGTGGLVPASAPATEPEFAPEPGLGDEQGVPALSVVLEKLKAGLAEEPAVPAAAELPDGPEAPGSGDLRDGPDVPPAADLPAGPGVPAAADLPHPLEPSAAESGLPAGPGLPGEEPATRDRAAPVPAAGGWPYSSGTGSSWQGPWTVGLPGSEPPTSELPNGTSPLRDVPGQAGEGSASASSDPLGLAESGQASDPLGLAGASPAGTADAPEQAGPATAGPAGQAGADIAGDTGTDAGTDPAGLPAAGPAERAGTGLGDETAAGTAGTGAGKQAAGTGPAGAEAGGQADTDPGVDWAKISSSAQIGQWATDLARDATGGWAGLPSEGTGSGWPGPPVPQPADVAGRNAPPAPGTAPDDPLDEHAEPASREDDEAAGAEAASGGSVPSAMGIAEPGDQPAAAADGETGPAVPTGPGAPGPAGAAAADAGEEQPGEPAGIPPADLPLADDATDPQLPAAGPAGPGSGRGKIGPGRMPPRPRSGESSGPRQSTRVLGARSDAEADADEWISLLRADPADD